MSLMYIKNTKFAKYKSQQSRSYELCILNID